MPDTDPTLPTPITIGDRLAWFRGDMVAGFAALSAKIDRLITSLDGGATPSPTTNVISQLTAANYTLTAIDEDSTSSIASEIINLRTAIQAGNGGASLLQIVNEIQALRGVSVDTAITGSRLTDLYSLFNPGLGISPYNILDTMYLVLTQINQVLGGDPNYTNTEIANIKNIVLSLLTSDITTRILAQLDTSVVTPTVKDLLMTLASNTTNPLNALPVDCCDTPLVSTSSFYVDTTAVFVTPVTIALWAEAPGGDFSSDWNLLYDGYDKLHCTDWTKYRIYVASKADSFGVIAGRGTRYPCNRWITLSIPEFGVITGAVFNVDRANSLVVYVCAISPTSIINADPGGCSALGTWTNDYRTTAMHLLGTVTQAGVSYDIYAPDIVEFWPYVKYYNLIDTWTTTAQQVVAYAPQGSPSTPVWMCVSWDFTGMSTVCVTMVTGNAAAPDAPPWPVSEPITNTLSGASMYTFDVEHTGVYGYQTCSWRVAVPTGVVPDNNMFLHVDISSVSGS